MNRSKVWKLTERNPIQLPAAAKTLKPHEIYAHACTITIIIFTYTDTVKIGYDCKFVWGNINLFVVTNYFL